MSEEKPASGGVPNAFGNALAWTWAPQMPRPLRQGFLKLLFVLRAIARGDGLIHGEHSAWRISQIAAASGADEKDTRRYLKAAIAAGVVEAASEPTRGRATSYRLVVTPWPDWEAAARSLEKSGEKRREQRAAKVPPWRQSSGDRPPNSEGGSSGDRPPNFGESSSGDRPPTEFGGPTPDEFGGPTPDNSGSTHDLSQEVAEVVPQPQDVRANRGEGQASEEAPARCTEPGCGFPLTPDGWCISARCRRRSRAAL